MHDAEGDLVTDSDDEFTEAGAIRWLAWGIVAVLLLFVTGLLRAVWLLFL